MIEVEEGFRHAENSPTVHMILFTAQTFTLSLIGTQSSLFVLISMYGYGWYEAAATTTLYLCIFWAICGQLNYIHFIRRRTLGIVE